MLTPGQPPPVRAPSNADTAVFGAAPLTSSSSPASESPPRLAQLASNSIRELEAPADQSPLCQAPSQYPHPAALSVIGCLSVLQDYAQPHMQEFAALRLRQLLQRKDVVLFEPFILNATVGTLLSLLDKSRSDLERWDSLPQKQLRGEVRETLRQVGRDVALARELDPEIQKRAFTLLIDNVDQVEPPYRPYIEMVALLFAPSRCRELASLPPIARPLELDSSDSVKAEPAALAQAVIASGVATAETLRQLLPHVENREHPTIQEWALLRVRQLLRYGDFAEPPTPHEAAALVVSVMRLCDSNPTSNPRGCSPHEGVRLEALETVRRFGFSPLKRLLDAEQYDEVFGALCMLIYHVPHELRRYVDDVAFQFSRKL